MSAKANLSPYEERGDLLHRLAAPFADADVEWRVQQVGETHGRVWARVLPYVTARAVMQRLDEVFGVDGWQVTYTPGPVGGAMATLSVRVRHEDGSVAWITKSDGADFTEVEGVKGAYSGALKRAAVLLGVGRYLYNAGDFWAVVHDGGRLVGRTKGGRSFRWDPPLVSVGIPSRAGGAAGEPGTTNVGVEERRASTRTLKAIEEALGQLHIVDERVARRLRARVGALRSRIEGSEAYAQEILEKIRFTVGATPISADPSIAPHSAARRGAAAVA